MSWDILPKSNLQYFLTKLKGIFDNKVDKETGKGLFSGSYNDLTNKPTIPAAQVNSDWNASSGVAQILNKPTIPAAQVNSDWNASSGVAQILNKPTITDDKVKQTPVSNSSNYEVLFSGTADNVERTEGAKKSNLLRFNPNVGTLWATNVSASKLAYVNNTCFKSSNPPATMAVVEVPTVSGQLALLKPVSEAEYAALSQAEKTNGTIYFRYEANGIMREIQDNGSATSLTSGALPTGQTITSYLNSNFTNWTAITSSSHTVSGYYLKIGKLVIATGAYKCANASSETVFTNLPIPIQQVAIPARDTDNGNLHTFWFSNSAPSHFGTSGHLGTMTVGNNSAFSIAYLTN